MRLKKIYKSILFLKYKIIKIIKYNNMKKIIDLNN